MRKRFQELFLIHDLTGPSGILKGLVRVNFIYAPIAALLVPLLFNGLDNFYHRFIGSYVISACTGTFCFVGVTLVSRFRTKFTSKWRGLPKEEGKFFGIIWSIIFILPGLYLGFACSELVMAGLGSPWFINGPGLSDYSAGIVFGLLGSSIFFALHILKEQEKSDQLAKDQIQILENARLKAEAAALSAQLNPHFLFNSLNTIAAAIPEHPNQAEDMVVQLADLYRAILRAAKKQSHSLEDELSICRAYLDIEAMRFGERVQYDIQVDSGLNLSDIMIPVMLIQPLVENAIKHGIAPKKDGGHIWVRITTKMDLILIQVKDNGIGLNSNTKTGEKTGLENCLQRLKLLHGPDASLYFEATADGAQVNIRLPRKL